MLLELAVGDAYGIAHEFADQKGTNDVRAYGFNAKHPDLGGGRYTDDTQRAIANAEVILRGEGNQQCDYISAYLEAFARDPRPGYSTKFYEFLQTTKTEKEWLAKMRPYGQTNGALMGVAPLGYLKTIGEIREAVYAQAMTTHAPETFFWAEAVALMAHFFIHDVGPKAELPEFLEEYAPLRAGKTPDDPLWWSDYVPLVLKPVSMMARDTAPAVFHVIMTNDNLSRMIWHAVDLGGDTDTVAACCAAIGSCSKEVENNLPQSLLDGLERGPYGYDYLIDLDRKLAKL